MSDVKDIKGFQDQIVNDRVAISKALKGMFGVIYKYELNRNKQYLVNEKEIAQHALSILTAVVKSSEDPEVIEAYEYPKMLYEERSLH